MAMAGFANAVLLQWPGLSMVRFVNVQDVPRPAIIASGVVAMGFGSLSLLVVVGMAALFSLLTWKSAFLIWILGSALGLFDFAQRFQNISFRAGTYFRTALLRGAVLMLAGLVACKIWPVAATAVLIMALSSLVPIAFSLFSGTVKDLFHWRKKLVIDFARYAWPLALSSAFLLLVDWSDRFFLKHFLGEAAVGIYAVNYDFTQYVIGAIALVATLLYHPHIYALFEKKNQSAVVKTLSGLNRFLLLVCGPLCVVCIIIPTEIINLIFGPRYAEASGLIMPFVAISVLMSSLKAFCIDIVFMLEQKTYFQLVSIVCGAILSLVLNIIFIPKYGVAAAAANSAASFSFAYLVSMLLGLRLKAWRGAFVRNMEVLGILLLCACSAVMVSLYFALGNVIAAVMFMVLYMPVASVYFVRHEMLGLRREND